MKPFAVASLPVLLFSFSLHATPPRIAKPDQPHYVVLKTDKALRDDEKAALRARGYVPLQVLSDRTYMLARSPGAAPIDSSTPWWHAQEIDDAWRLQPSARRELARPREFARLAVIFQADVTLDEASETMLAAGTIDTDPLRVAFAPLHRIDAFVPKEGAAMLARDERVLQIAAPAGEMKSANVEAAQLSRVDVVQAAPYGLTGAGIPTSVWDCGAAQATHPEFGGRLTAHTTATPALHPTHVSGTIAAQGVDPQAKGMAPAATVDEFDLGCPSGGQPFDQSKQENFPKYGILADNNSWNLVIGWDESASGAWTFNTNTEYFGAYSYEATALDRLSNSNPTVIVFAAGNDDEDTGPTNPPYPHKHDDSSTIYCYSENGSGTDCPTSTCAQCETIRHPPDGPFLTVGPTGSGKDVIAVGAVDGAAIIAPFSSRGPTRDGRVKPDIVARGVDVYSSVPTNSYRTISGTSMSSPVVTGSIALIDEQWRKTFGGSNPPGDAVRALLVEGADDLGNPGPDYTYGFGLLDMKNTIDLLVADAGTGARIQRSSVTQGTTVSLPLHVSSPMPLRVTLAWTDPEAVLSDIAARSLVNDLDLVVRDPSGELISPYVLDPSNPDAVAGRGTNNRDTIEEVEIPNAQPGNYTVLVKGTSVSTAAGQAFTVVANGDVGPAAVACADPFEPNDTVQTAAGIYRPGTITATSCSPTDLDFYEFVANVSGPVSVTVTATDTPLRLTLSGPEGTFVANVVPGGTATLQTTAATGSGAPIAPQLFTVEVAPTGAVGSSGKYSVTFLFGTNVTRWRAIRR